MMRPLFYPLQVLLHEADIYPNVASGMNMLWTC